MKFLDLFSGIGGFRMGMQRNGHESIGYIEKDKFARKSYEAIYDVRGEWTAKDVQQIEPEEIPDFDVLCAGFPCQDFSVAGDREGLEGTRGTLFHEIGRIAKVKRPDYLFLENVKGLLSHDGGRTFGIILKSLGELGYNVEWQVLNSKNFGVPQNRERVFFIGYLGKKPKRTVFPVRGETKGTLEEIIGGSQGYRVYNPDGLSVTLAGEAGGLGAKTGLYIDHNQPKIRNQSTCVDHNYHKGFDNHGARTGILEYVGSVSNKPWLSNDNDKSRGHHEGNRVYDSRGLCPTLATRKGGASGNSQVILEPVMTPEYTNKGMNKKSQIGSEGGNMFTVDSTSQHGIYNGASIRKLTPKETWRLQGFPDWAYKRARVVNSVTQLYRQAGNAVTVNVVETIAKLFKEV